MPELAIHPGDAGDESIGLDGAQNLPGLGLDLVDLSLAKEATKLLEAK